MSNETTSKGKGVSYHYYRSADAQDRNHGVCFGYKVVDGKLDKIMHAAVFHHGVAVEVLPVNTSVGPDGKVKNSGVKLYEMKRAAADFKITAPRLAALKTEALESTEAEVQAAPAAVLAPQAPGAAA